MAVPGGAANALEEEDYAGVNAALVQHHVLPGYERLESASRALNAVVQRRCRERGGDGLDDLRVQFDAAMDAWMGVQHLRFGPIELFDRGYRLYFWPEGQGRIAAAVEALLSAGDDSKLEAEAFADVSVAVQGLPAMEYLLYSTPNPLGSSNEGRLRCRLLMAIATNVKGIAAGVLADWQGGKIAFAQSVAEPEPETGFFESHKDATLELFKGFYTGLQLIADVRLKPALGAGLQQARPRLAESRLSQRSLRNIAISLQALQALYHGEGAGLGALVVQGGSDPKLDPLMERAFRKTLETASAVPPTLGEAVVDPPRRAQVETLHIQARALKQIVETRMAEAVGLGIGFNALDGD